MWNLRIALTLRALIFYTSREVARGVWSASERVTDMSKSQYFGLAVYEIRRTPHMCHM